MTWPKNLAKEIDRKIKKGVITIATGITPSGPIHIGNLREVVTGWAVAEELKKLKRKVEFIWISDDFDPLRHLYPFLAPEFEKYIGWPLCDIPDPIGKCHANYATHFSELFLETLTKMEIRPTYIKTSQYHRNGKYAAMIKEALTKKEQIKEILTKISGHKLNRDWSPFNPLCPKCNSFKKTKVLNWDNKSTKIKAECECGWKGEVDFAKGGGKLMWRVDWPARWKMLNIEVEPFGKDHAAAGGSWDTGKKISGEVFDYPPPFPIIYEWINLKNQGAMSSSKGIAITTDEMLDYIPPEILKFLYLRIPPTQHIDFDPGLGLIKLVDDYDREEQKNEIPFRHLIATIQAANFNFKEIKRILEHTGHLKKISDQELQEKIERARNWLKSFAPKNLKFKVQENLPKEAAKISLNQKRMLKEVIQIIEENPDAEKLHNAIYELGKKNGLTPAQTFQPFYLAILGQLSGPKLGWFLKTLDQKFVLKRIREASE